MRHAVVGREGHVVAGPDLLARREAEGVALDDLFGEGLGRGGGGGEGRAGGLELRGEGILLAGGRAGAGRVGEGPRGAGSESGGGSREGVSAALGGVDGCEPPLGGVSTGIA